MQDVLSSASGKGRSWPLRRGGAVGRRLRSASRGSMARKSAKVTGGAKATPSTNSQADLLKTLWESAVNLRGAIEPADYKRYVLPLIFLRFLSLRYERRRTELERLIGDPKSDYHTTDPKVAQSI